MDRTLVRRDTAGLYMRYRRQIGAAGLADSLRVGWWMLQYSLGVIDADRVAEEALSDYRGKREQALVEICRHWFRRYVLEHVVADGREAVRRHREAGDLLAIVTGATRYAAEPLAEELGIEHVVCSQLEVAADGRFTGRVVRPLGYGRGKVALAERCAAELGFRLEDATFYSDSFTDLPLLERVAEPVAVNPDTRLWLAARRRGWSVQRWR